MHVGGTAGDIAESGSFEGSAISLEVTDGLAADVGLGGLHANTDVVEAVVGQIGATVTGAAVGLAEEERSALAGLFGESLEFAGEEPVEGRGAGDGCAFVAGDGTGDIPGDDRLGTEDLAELVAVAGDLIEAGFELGEGEAHLNGIGDGAEGLLLQGVGATVPELEFLEGGIEDGGGVASPLLALNAGGELISVAEALFGIVTIGAGDGVVEREATVEVELSTEGDFFVGLGVIGGDGEWREFGGGGVGGPGEGDRSESGGGEAGDDQQPTAGPEGRSGLRKRHGGTSGERSGGEERIGCILGDRG